MFIGCRVGDLLRLKKSDVIDDKEEKQPINEIGSMTGHIEGSRAFNRYRTIDIDMKKDLVKILEGGK